MHTLKGLCQGNHLVHSLDRPGLQVSRPAEVIAAEQSRGRMSDEDIVRILTAFNVAVGKVSRLVRALLHDYRGYECKEPEPGKFTLAFQYASFASSSSSPWSFFSSQEATGLNLIGSSAVTWSLRCGGLQCFRRS